MNRPTHITEVFIPLILIFCIQASRGGSATWDLNPASGDWNSAGNWTPVTVPNGPADTATFQLSNTTAVSNSANTIVGGITFAPGANSFTITASGSLALILSGAGVTNNSGVTQNFVAAPSAAPANAIRLFFKNSATAGSGTFFTMNGGATADGSPGWIFFQDTSSADHGTFTNNGPTVPGTFGGGATGFANSASAGNGTFINNGGTISSQFGGDQGLTFFNDTSTAANGMFINNAGTVVGAHGGVIGFNGNTTAANGTFINNGSIVTGASGGETTFSGVFSTPTAGDATIINNGAGVTGAAGGTTEFFGFFGSNHFYGNATAGNATIISNGGTAAGANGGETRFITEFHTPQEVGRSTAANATLIANGGTNGGQGGAIFFEGFSSGGTSRVEVFGNGNLDISFHQDLVPRRARFRPVTVGSIEGDGNVFLGSNNLTVGSSDVSTTFSGVIQDGGGNGGTGGSLTKIGSGTLDLAGANTYTGNTNIRGGVLKVDGSITSNTFVDHGGTLTGTGTVQGDVTNNGEVSPGDAPGTMTVKGNYIQNSRGSLLIDIAGTSTGEFSVLDVLGNAKLSGALDPVLLNGFVPTVGETFTFLDYGSLTGKLFVFDRNIDNAAEHWKVTYNPTNAILTVAPGNVPLPDTESTLLLLTLSLLGLGSTAIKCRTTR